MAAIKVATFNLYNFAEKGTYWYKRIDKFTYTDTEWSEKVQWIKGKLITMNADIVGFQEIFCVSEWEKMVEECGYAYHYAQKGVQIDGDMYTAPVVGIASRYPFEVCDVDDGENGEVVQCDDVFEGFSFRRKPVRVKIEIDGEELLVFVLHLKSKSVHVNNEQFDNIVDWKETIREAMLYRSRGAVAAMVQRGMESSALYHLIVKEVEKDFNTPIIVLGDLNDDDESVTLEILQNKRKLEDINGVDVPQDAVSYVFPYRLYDVAVMRDVQSDTQRKNTYQYRDGGSVLDYILVSNGLNTRNTSTLKKGTVVCSKVYDEHFHDDVSKKVQSDHAPVTAIIEFPLRVAGRDT